MNAAASSLFNEGLCSTCNHAAECIYLASAAVPIWRCEDFDDHVAPAALDSSVAMEVQNDTRPARPVPAGICSNCDNLGTCMYPKPEGGIWRCEEYR